MRTHIATPAERMANFKKLHDKVEYCLANFEDTRNDDIELTKTVWRQFYWIGDSITLDQLNTLPRESAIVRLRASIQNNEGKYYPTSLAIARKRGIEEVAWQEYMRSQANKQGMLL